jgi:hypothetical protein
MWAAHALDSVSVPPQAAVIPARRLRISNSEAIKCTFIYGELDVLLMFNLFSKYKKQIRFSINSLNGLKKEFYNSDKRF